MSARVVNFPYDEKQCRELGRDRGLRFALATLLDLANEHAKVKAQKKLNGEPSDRTLAKELEQFGSDISPVSTVGDAFSSGFRESVENVRNVLREDILGNF